MNDENDEMEMSDNNEDAQRVVIIGAAGGGIEVLVYLLEMIKNGASAETYGFIDDNPSLEGEAFLDVPVLGNTEWALENLPKDVAVVSSIGNTSKKDTVMKRFAEAGFEFFTIIHPHAFVGPNVEIGPGCIIGPGCVLTTKITIGEHTSVNIGTTISHDVTIGPSCTINQGARIAGSVKLGRGVYIGASATILHSMEIGEFTVIGASAMVNRHIPPRVNAVGIPAKVMHAGGRGGRSGGGYRGRDSRSGGGYQGRDTRSGGGYQGRDSRSGGGYQGRDSRSGGGYNRDRDRGGYSRDRDRGGSGSDRDSNFNR